MGFDLNVSVPAVTVFFQGLLSFFSPCVLPLLPLYIGYLSGGTAQRLEDGRMAYDRRKVLTNTVAFVIGISFAFVLLGMGVSALGKFFQGHQTMFVRAGGVLIILFGFYQLGFFGKSGFLEQEKRLPWKLGSLAMSPLTALLLGFTFSFAWTPCVGPMLSSVLILAASSPTKGMLLIGIYTLGFVLPFLAVGFFTTTLLDLFKKNMNVVKYTVKAGGVLMVLIGLMLFTGRMNDVSNYMVDGTQSAVAGQYGEKDMVADIQSAQKAAAAKNGAKDGKDAATGDAAKDANAAKSSGGATAEAASAESGNDGTTTADGRQLPVAADFELKDQYGNVHRLSDYRGKTVFLNFWATWCPPCRAEMPDIQKLYETSPREGKDAVIVLAVAGPGIGSEKNVAGVTAFLKEHGYTYPVLMDTEGKLFSEYGIQAFPTTFMINRAGRVYGYVSGMLSPEMMRSIIRQTQEGK